MKAVPDKDILLFRSCLVSVEYPGVESSTKFVFDKLGVDYEISDKQTCCTGLGHYSDVFNQIDTSAIGARNFKIAKDMGRPNLVMMCATCYAINKKSVKLLNKKDDLRDHINQLFDENGLSHLKYEKDDLKPTENIYHVVDILYGKKDEIKDVKDGYANYLISQKLAVPYTAKSAEVLDSEIKSREEAELAKVEECKKVKSKLENKNHFRGSIKQHPISHVLYWTIIYLHICASQIVSFHYCKFPYQNLGFSLMGFITFHSYISIRLVSLTLLQAPSMDFSLGFVPAVSRNCPSLLFHLA